MVTVAQSQSCPLSSPALRDMFEARKRVFVDLLRWDIPVLEDRYEIDQFDDEHAVYLIVADEEGRHAASARLLPSTRPHILDTLFPQLCAGPPPVGPQVFEITRFCLDPRGTAQHRLEARNRLVSGLVHHALETGIATYTGVAEMGWLQQILAFGWDCRSLGLPVTLCGKMLGALRIDITAETPALLDASGILRAASLERIEFLEAA